jgi:AcrR family transcriptional regulator
MVPRCLDDPRTLAYAQSELVFSVRISEFPDARLSAHFSPAPRSPTHAPPDMNSTAMTAGLPVNQRSASMRARFAAGGNVSKILHTEYSGREEEIIRATYKVMARQGAQQLSLRQVAKEAKVSAAGLIYHFDSKYNLLLETMRWVLSRTVQRFEECFSEVEDAEDALAAFVGAIFVDAKANRDFYLSYLDLIQYGARNPSFRGLTDLLREHSTESFAFVIRQGVESGHFAVDDVDLAAARTRALVEGKFIQWLQDPHWKRTHDSLRDECHRDMLEMLRGTRTSLKRSTGRRRT